MKKSVLSILLLTTYSLNAIEYSSSYQNCLDNSGGSTSYMVKCNKQELKYQDKLLNKYYKQLMKSLPVAKQKELKSTQRLWIKYRDANCGFYANLTGGTMDILSSSGCMVDMTAQRAEELKEMYGSI